MGKQLHLRVDDEFVKSIFSKYEQKHLPLEKALDLLKIKPRQFYVLLKRYRDNPVGFTVKTQRESGKRLTEKAETVILGSLSNAKKLIDDPDIPVRDYNYSHIKDRIEKVHGISVSASTIIRRARDSGHYMERRKIGRKSHDREVLTDFPGELIQHDTSIHKFSPYSAGKWYLITSLDDYSRLLLYADLFNAESAWNHVMAARSLVLRYGTPLRYYTDNHSIFRFVQGRDSVWRKHKKTTDKSSPQWKQVMNDLNIEVVYALSPQAKGKIERPYRWLQDRLVRGCAEEHISTIDDAKKLLQYEVRRYNERYVHSTIKEIPGVRFEKAVQQGKSMFREFNLPAPYQSEDDIFCLRMHRTVDNYHKISVNNLKITVKGVPAGEKVQMRVVPDQARNRVCIRFWYAEKYVGCKTIRYSDFYQLHN